MLKTHSPAVVIVVVVALVVVAVVVFAPAFAIVAVVVAVFIVIAFAVVAVSLLSAGASFVIAVINTCNFQQERPSPLSWLITAMTGNQQTATTITAAVSNSNNSSNIQ